MRTQTTFVAAAILAGGALLGWAAASAQVKNADSAAPPALNRGTPDVLPRPDFRFRGNVGRTILDSDKPQFPQPVQAPKGAPNVVLILLDDTGFGQYSTFGGGIPSPTIQRLADEGLRYNRFHTTALCSPTRAALITGRNHTSRGEKPGGTLGEGGTVKLFVNGNPAGEGTIGMSMHRHGIEPFDVGRDSISPVSPDYKSRGAFPFTGKIDKITFEAGPPKK